jgi:hypothetical protein
MATEAVGSPQAPREAPRPRLLASPWRGAKAGFLWVSYVAGPIASVLLILGSALTAFGVGSGRGWGVHPMLPDAFRFYLGSVLCGVTLGAPIGLIAGLIGRVLPQRFATAWSAAVNRPIHMFRGRQIADAPVGGTPERRHRGRWLWLVGVPVPLGLATALGAGLYFGRMVDQRLALAIATADRDDPFWRIDDLMTHRDPVPDAENSALVVVEALSHLPKSWPAYTSQDAGGPNSAPKVAYEQITAFADNVRMRDEAAATLRGELEKYDEALRIARTLANYRRGRHELELGPTLIDTPLPETQNARDAARFLAADAAIRTHDGDFDGALDSCRAILGVGRSIGDEPTLISFLVRAAIGGVAMKSARRVLGQGEPSDAALAKLETLVLDELSQPLLLNALKGERATLTELIRRVGVGAVPISALSGDTSELGSNRRRHQIAPWGKLMFDNQEALALEWMNHAVAIAREPIATRPDAWKAWQHEIDRLRKTWHVSFTSTLPVLMTPSIGGSGTADARYASELSATAILLAAERHRQKTGSWPAAVSAIDLDILPNAPIDPYSGHEFQLELRDRQIFIYSIGPNGKDEHGAYNPKRWMEGDTDDVGASAWDVPKRRQPTPP